MAAERRRRTASLYLALIASTVYGVGRRRAAVGPTQPMPAARRPDRRVPDHGRVREPDLCDRRPVRDHLVPVRRDGDGGRRRCARRSGLDPARWRPCSRSVAVGLDRWTRRPDACGHSSTTSTAIRTRTCEAVGRRTRRRRDRARLRQLLGRDAGRLRRRRANRRRRVPVLADPVPRPPANRRGDADRRGGDRVRRHRRGPVAAAAAGGGLRPAGVRRHRALSPRRATADAD